VLGTGSAFKVVGTGSAFNEVKSPKHVVHVAALEQELVSKYALDNEAAGLIQPSRAVIATQYAEAQLACAAVACLLDSGFDELSTDPEASAVGVDAEPIELQHVLVRRESDGPTELAVSGDDAVDLSDEHVVGSCPLVEERSAGRGCRGGRDVVGPGDGVQVPEKGVVPALTSSNRYHPDRMPQRCPPTKGHVPSSAGDVTGCRG